MVYSLLHILFIPTLLGLAAGQTTVYNNCPTSIDLYVNGRLQGSVPSRGITTNVSIGGFSSFLYTDANGGYRSGDGATGVGFGGTGENNYYWIVSDARSFNTGVSVSPGVVPQASGACKPITCDSSNCATAYYEPPTGPPFPATAVPPLYACPQNVTTEFTVTFCPDGIFPITPHPPLVQIHYDGSNDKCLDVRGGVFADGTPVQLYECNDTPAQNWNINLGSTKVQVNGTNYCLDAGDDPASGTKLKIWTCYDNLPAQAWNYTTDYRVHLANTNQCLDLPSGNTTNSNQVQIWECTAQDFFQDWTTTY